MSSFRVALISSLMVAAPIAAVHADVEVVVSIKPIHSLVAGVMSGVGSPTLIVEGNGSPHTYSLKPSHAAKIETADLIFWVGHRLEPFLEKPLESLGAKGRVVELMDTEGLVHLAFREGGGFEGHDHDHGDHDDHGNTKKGHDDHGPAKDDDHHAEKHDEHDHEKAKHDDHDREHHAEKHDDHDHEKAKHDDHDREHHAEKHDDHEKAKHDDHDREHHAEKHDDHDRGHSDDAHDEDGDDPHIWLNPLNAKVMVREIARNLAKVDPSNTATYKNNADAMLTQIDSVSAKISATLEPVRGRPFIVFHDAYQYFEDRFGLQAAGSITTSPEVMPGAARIKEMQKRVRDLGAVCVFSEPQFTPKLVSVVTEGSAAKQGVLDPLGAALSPGPDLYITLIKNIAGSMATCLSRSS